MADNRTSSLRNGSYTMPPQKLPMSKKGKKWREQCVNAVANRGAFGYDGSGRAPREQKQINYNLVNSIFDEKDYSYILSPYNIPTDKIKVNSPSKLRNYNIITNKVNRIKGEEMARNFDFEIFAINGDAVTKKQEDIKETLISYLKEYIFNLEEPKIDPETGKPVEMEPPEAIKNQMAGNYKTLIEETANHLMNYLYHHLNLKFKFNKGFEHGLISGEEIYRVGIVNGEPSLRAVNPLFCDFDRDPDLEWVEDCSWFREDRYMTPAQIIDEYGEYLSDKEIHDIEEMMVSESFTHLPSNGHDYIIPGMAYDEPHRKGGHNFHVDGTTSEFLLVSVCTWKSFKKIGFLSYVDQETGEVEEDVVDDDFELSEEMEEQGAQIDWKWITEVWEGTKIGDIYVNVNPLPNQMRNNESMTDSKLPYVGSLYNVTNSQSTSFVDFLRPFQYLYNIMWFRLEEEIAKAKGKKFVMDLAQIPKSEGIDMDTWIEYFDNMGIGFINSAEEGLQNSGLGPSAASSFNQFQAVDMSLSQSVGQYIAIIQKIELVVDNISGISKQAEGQIQATETAKGVTESIKNSSYVVEPYFYKHTEIKKRTLEQLIEVSKLSYINGKKVQYMTHDAGVQFLDVDGGQMSLSDFGVFVADSLLESVNREKLEQLAFAAMQNGMMKFSEVARMFTSTSLNKSIRDIQVAEDKMEQQQARQQQAEQQMQKQQMAAEQQEKQAELENENMNKALDRETDIQVATINAMGDIDENENIEKQTKNINDQQKLALQEMKDSTDAALKNKELELKEKEIEAKKEIETKKAETDLKVAKENKNKYDV